MGMCIAASVLLEWILNLLPAGDVRNEYCFFFFSTGEIIEHLV